MPLYLHPIFSSQCLSWLLGLFIPPIQSLNLCVTGLKIIAVIHPAPTVTVSEKKLIEKKVINFSHVTHGKHTILVNGSNDVIMP